jgi:peptidyl-prolyl cis-trans isomerase SurA
MLNKGFMRIYLVGTILLLISVFSKITGQQERSQDPVLFTINNKPVQLSEFEYIYNKTSSGNADYSMASLEEYLDLYVKFKLKVERAKDMRLDTVTALARELETYRRQLADSYLMDKEVTEKLIQEVYERKLKEREVSHILYKYKKGMDTTEQRKIAEGVLAMLLKGSDFVTMAKAQSEDQNVEKNNGNLGFITAMMPNGFYDFENAAFETPVGQVCPRLIYTPMGIHIVKVNSERPASGEIEVAHILIRDPDNARVEGANQKIEKAYTLLQSGTPFDAVANEYSEDRLTAGKAGYLGFFGINRYEKAFEDAAFGLTENGAYSKPFRTSLGWHIVKRLSKKELEPLPIVRGRIQNQIMQDQRFEQEKAKMIERIKINAGFQENTDVINAYINQLNMEFLTFRWKPIESAKKNTIFTFGEGKESTIADFEEYLVRNQRKRLQMAKDSNVVAAARELYNDFINEKTIKYEEAKLEAKYPEFKALMREYEEGILLFEATKMMVWDKASQDTAGLRSFHDKNKQKYMWGERAKIVNYTFNGVNQKNANKMMQFAVKNGPEKTKKKYNKKSDLVYAEIAKIERQVLEQSTDIPWTAGYQSTLTPLADDVFIFSHVEELLGPEPKLLSEARGYIIADYQDYLEKQWVESLRGSYPIKINREVINAIAK